MPSRTRMNETMKKGKVVNQNNRIHIRQTENEVKQYQEMEKKQEKKIHYVFCLFLIWLGLFFCSLFFAVAYNQWHFSLAWVLKYASLNIENFYHFVMGSGAADGMDARFYQYLVIALTGAALAACGTIFQGTFKNMLAGPSTMGVMSGGTLGAAIYIFFFTTPVGNVVIYDAAKQAEEYMQSGILHRYAQAFFVLGGSFGGVLLIMTVALAAGKGKLSSSNMVISGMVFSTGIRNVVMVMQYYMLALDPSDGRVEAIRDVMMGNFDNTGRLEVLVMMGIPICIGLAVLLMMRRKLNLFSFEEEEAAAMGVDIIFYRNMVVAVGTVLTAVVVAFCGHVGFLGFMIPLIGRKIAGPDMSKLLPVSLLVGAILLTLIFDVAYFLRLTDSMNIVTSAIGCVVMIVVLIQKKGGGKDAAWQGPLARHMGAR